MIYEDEESEESLHEPLAKRPRNSKSDSLHIEGLELMQEPKPLVIPKRTRNRRTSYSDAAQEIDESVFFETLPDTCMLHFSNTCRPA
jgi:hypothetical protein